MELTTLLSPLMLYLYFFLAHSVFGCTLFKLGVHSVGTACTEFRPIVLLSARWLNELVPETISQAREWRETWHSNSNSGSRRAEVSARWDTHNVLFSICSQASGRETYRCPVEMYRRRIGGQSANWKPGPGCPKGPQNTVVFTGFNMNGHEAHPGGARSALGFQPPLPFTYFYNF